MSDDLKMLLGVLLVVLLAIWAATLPPAPVTPRESIVDLPPLQETVVSEDGGEMPNFGADMVPASPVFHNTADLDGYGSAFPYPAGDPTDSYRTWSAGAYGQQTGFFDPMPGVEDDPAGDQIYATYLTMEGDVPQSFFAYLLREETVVAKAKVRCAVYTEAGAFVAGSDWQILGDGEGWIEFPLTGTPPALVEGTKYVLWVTTDHPVEVILALACGEVPVVISAANTIELANEPVVELQAVAGGAAGPLFTGGGML